ncbi:MAG: GAF domain-containing protein [Pseudomonadota bacterium]
MNTLPAPFEAIFARSTTPDAKLKALMPAIVRTMATDRCFIYMRDPVKRRTAYTHGHTALQGWRHFGGGSWGREPNPATLNEPMLKKAFTDPTALFISDIETAPAHVLNKRLERAYFGHRALVHAPLYHRGRFYGILETAVRRKPRVWSAQDKQLIIALQPRVAALAARYLGHA